MIVGEKGRGWCLVVDVAFDHDATALPSLADVVNKQASRSVPPLRREIGAGDREQRSGSEAETPKSSTAVGLSTTAPLAIKHHHPPDAESATLVRIGERRPAECVKP